MSSDIVGPLDRASERKKTERRSARAVAIESLGPLSARGLAAWYARASIFAHPSRYEPFGLSILEAALATPGSSTRPERWPC